MRFLVDANLSIRLAEHLRAAQQGASGPSFVLLRQLHDRKVDALAALLLANLDAVADDLVGGAIVTLTPRHLRVRPLPIRRAP